MANEDTNKFACVACGRPINSDAAKIAARIPARDVIVAKLGRADLTVADLGKFVVCGGCGVIADRKGAKTAAFTAALAAVRMDEEERRALAAARQEAQEAVKSRIGDLFGVSIEETEEATVTTITPTAARKVKEGGRKRVRKAS
ncbi:MAG: hypothetical protein PHD72_01480 [Patescibacteria group bacterium]|nr:hypothetical protein [Patescibacteria group bacterium]